MININMKKFDKNLPDLEHIGGNKRSNWVDVRASVIEVNGKPTEWVQEMLTIGNEVVGYEEYIRYSAGDVLKIKLGFGMELPEGFEAHVAPRGSTFKCYGIIQVNSVGVVDETYCGDNDEWFIPCYALQAGKIYKYDRIAQFRILEKMPDVNYNLVNMLGNKDRGGHGSSGNK